MSSATLKQQAIVNTAWTIFGYGTSQILRLGSNLILTRLLIPELFGLMALVNVFIVGINLFSDLGIQPSIIQNKRGDETIFLNTAWTIQVIRGFGIWVGCLLIAFPVAQFYEEPRLRWLIPIVGLNSIISGFNSTSIASLSRHMAVGKIIRFELGTQIVSLVALITWAFLSPTIWALVGGSLISVTCKAFWSHHLNSQLSNRFAWDKDVIQDISSFGRWIFLSTAMTFLATQTDRLILGKLLDLEMLSFYIVALTLADIPRQVMAKVSSQVMYPLITKYASLPRASLREKIVKQRGLILIAQAIALTIMVSFGDFLVTTLYDARYYQATWIIPILAIGLWPLMLSLTSDKVLLAIGNPNYAALGNMFKFIYMLIGLPLAYSVSGVLGAIVVIAFNDLPFYGVVSYGLWREKLSTFKQDFVATTILLGLLCCVLTARYMLGFGLPIDKILS